MTRLVSRILLAMMVLGAAGCNLNSYFDPTRTGRFEYTPTTIPILERIDVIEHERDPWVILGDPRFRRLLTCVIRSTMDSRSVSTLSVSGAA